MDDQNPGLDSASEGAEDLELEKGEPVEGLPDPGGDPLDDIQDPVARDEAKKWRAIARRKEEKREEPKVETPPTTPNSDYLTKADFFKANERKAIREAIADPEVKANWNEIIPFYTSRRGKETPEDIAEDIKDAITLYNARHVAPQKDESADQLATNTVVKSGGGTVEKATKKVADPPNFKLPTQPKDWYATKS